VPVALKAEIGNEVRLGLRQLPELLFVVAVDGHEAGHLC